MWTFATAFAAFTLMISPAGNSQPTSSIANSSANLEPNAVTTKADITKLPYSRIPAAYLNPAADVDRIAAMISSNEGKPNSIVWNDNGAGISVGLLQANQKKGQLPDLFRRTAESEQGRAEIIEAFGQNKAAQILEDPETIRNWRFSRRNGLGKSMLMLANSPTFQNVQLAVLRENIVHAAEISAQHNIESSAGVALVADLVNQWGERGAHRFIPDGIAEDRQIASQIVAEVETQSPYGERYREDLNKAIADGLSFNEPFSSEPQLTH